MWNVGGVGANSGMQQQQQQYSGGSSTVPTSQLQAPGQSRYVRIQNSNFFHDPQTNLFYDGTAKRWMTQDEYNKTMADAWREYLGQQQQ